MQRNALLSLAVFLIIACQEHTQGSAPDLDKIFQERPIRIGAFNIRTFGVRKYENVDVVETLKKIVARYDILLVQEIRDITNTTIYNLLDKTNSDFLANDPLSIVISDRLGDSHSKEQYAFLYRESVVRVIQTYQYEDPLDRFERPPFAVHFRSDVLELGDFGIIGIHTKPDDAVEEISALEHVYTKTKETFGVSNILIAGDLNAGCDYVSKTKMKTISIRNSDYTWLVNDSVDTTVSSSDCAYDRFVVRGHMWKHVIVAGSVQVFRFDDAYGLTNEQALEVSDHYPIEMNITGKCNEQVQKTTESSSTITVKEKTNKLECKATRDLYRQSTRDVLEPLKWNIVVLKNDGRLHHVEILKTHITSSAVADELLSFTSIFSLTTISLVNKLVLEPPFSENPVIGCVNDVHGHPVLVDVKVSCWLQAPCSCQVDVTKRIS